MKRNKRRGTVKLILALVLCTAMLSGIFQSATAKAAVSETYRDREAKLAYTLKNIPHGGAAIQNIYVTENYVYTTQRFDASGGKNRNDVAFGRFAINKAQKTATYKDEMTLLDCGHGEILDRYSYRNAYYFLVGAKALDNNDAWSLQVARLKYEPGTKKKYTQLCRLAGLACANSSGKSKLDAVRVAAAASGDDTQLAIRTELETKDGKKRYLQYSIYKLKEVNALLDKVEKKTENYLSFKGNAALKKLCSYSYCPAKGQAVQPNGSFQGMEISGSAIYISGGRAGGGYPKIAKLNRNNGQFAGGVNLTTSELSKDNKIILRGKEIEGLCCRGDKLYFGIRNGREQSIHFISKF